MRKKYLAWKRHAAVVEAEHAQAEVLSSHDPGGVGLASRARLLSAQ
jgi:hypothetical protein